MTTAARSESTGVSRAVADAYSRTGAAWQRGPGAIYDRLAEVVVAGAPRPLGGCAALDVGAGTGAATRALLAAGARSVVALDSAPGMLAHDATRRPPAVVADALALPFATASFDAAVAAFSLNHVVDPVAGLREMARVTCHGGAVVVAAYADDDTHPVKAAVEQALTARGWAPEPWYAAVRACAIPLLASVDSVADVGRAAGLRAQVDAVRVPFPDLGAADLVEWRLGMAQHAPFVASLPADARAAAASDALARLGPDAPPLVRSIIVLAAPVP